MDPSTTEVKVQHLVDRLAIFDVVQAYARSQDCLDRELFETAYHPAALDDHMAFVGDRDEFWDWSSNLLRDTRDGTMHLVSNHSVVTDWQMPAVNTPEAVDEDRALPPFPHVGGRERKVALTGLKSSRDRNDPSYVRPFEVSRERLEKYRAISNA